MEQEQLLPSIDERPQADVVIFDGQCGFCQAQVRRLARWDWTGRLAFVSLHDPRVQERYPDLTHEQLMQQMFVVDRSGRRHGGAAAIRYLSRTLPALWWCAPLLHIPGTLPLWGMLYRFIARRRYAVWSRQASCSTQYCAAHVGSKEEKLVACHSRENVAADQQNK